MSKISKNIRYLRNLKNISQEVLADDLRITRARLGAYEEGRNEPPVEMLIKLSDYFHVAVDALIRGDLTKTNPEALMKVGKNRILFPVMVNEKDEDLIELIPAKAQAGYLAGYGDPEYIEFQPKIKLPFVGTGKYRAFQIRGDSMLPLKEGSYIVGKYVESLKDISEGKTYIILTKNDGIVYKRIYNNINKNKLIELHSDNQEYKPFNIKPEEILELWEFTCSIHTETGKPSDFREADMLATLKKLEEQIRNRSR